MLLCQGTYFLTGSIVRCNRSTDGNAAVFSDFVGHKADTPDIQISMLLGKTQLGGEVLPHDIPIQQRHRTTAALQQPREKSLCYGRLAGAGKAGKKDRKALFITRWMSAPELCGNLGKGKPGRYLSALGQPGPELCSRNSKRILSLFDLVYGDISVQAAVSLLSCRLDTRDGCRSANI